MTKRISTVYGWLPGKKLEVSRHHRRDPVRLAVDFYFRSNHVALRARQRQPRAFVKHHCVFGRQLADGRIDSQQMEQRWTRRDNERFFRQRVSTESHRAMLHFYARYSIEKFAALRPGGFHVSGQSFIAAANVLV